MTPTYNRYLEEEVLNADPLKLVQMLYRGAIDAVAAARYHVARKNILERSRAITRAMEIINQLMATLDHSKGGEISRNLGSLYDYVQWRLLTANSQQTDEPLADVDKILCTLLEGWRDAAGSPPPNAASAEPESISCSY